MGVKLLPRLLPALLLIGTVFAVEKQIKLEDIEKDNLKADQQTKLEKQYQQFQQQYQQYQGSSVQYPSQYQTSTIPSTLPTTTSTTSGLNYQQQQNLAYQQYQQAANPQTSAYPSYLLPYNSAQQQYLQQALYQNSYPHLTGNSIGSPYQGQGPQSAGSIHPLQAYYSQLSQVPSGQGLPSSSQQQSYIMAFASPAGLGGLQQQQPGAYYQGFPSLPYMTGQSGPGSFYFPQQQAAAGPVPPSSLSSGPQQPSFQFSPEQFVPPFTPINNAGKLQAAYNPSSPISSGFPQAYPTPNPFSSSQIFANAAETPTFIASTRGNHAASLGQQQQYLQAVASTPNPLQSKYQNSPQYLAQNYNTIQSSHVVPKSVYSSAKATASPPLKVASQGGFLPNSPTYQSYRSISG